MGENNTHMHRVETVLFLLTNNSASSNQAKEMIHNVSESDNKIYQQPFVKVIMIRYIPQL